MQYKYEVKSHKGSFRGERNKPNLAFQENGQEF
mgnify:CR=1 FL=1